MSSGSKRQSAAPPSGPKPPVNFSSTLTIPKEAALLGTHSITMQAETLIHPRARFDSTAGSILIGRRCIVHERAQVGAEPASAELAKPGGVTLGDYVTVEVGSLIESGGTEIGEGTIIQVGSKIGSGAKVGKVCHPMPCTWGQNLILTRQQNCTITSRTVIAPAEVIPDNTVIHSNGKRRVDRRRVLETRKVALVKQISVARKMIRSDPEKFQ